ncbi:hypothetical protein [Serratia sp. FGI94]|uniref:hypothetical protein n=1 Tax=Serratia sp. FGI94 TaxID=671990 RepID=UPI000F4ED798|nr:hypothetical protein [Serratia sp. FGI94]
MNTDEFHPAIRRVFYYFRRAEIYPPRRHSARKNSLNAGQFFPDKYRHTLHPQAADIYQKIRPLQWNILPSPPIILIIGNSTIAKIMPDVNRRSRHL